MTNKDSFLLLSDGLYFGIFLSLDFKLCVITVHKYQIYVLHFGNALM